ncbi:SCO3242 family prenyltransferase [Streptomyces sp. NPDC000229]|uniref:SCO3242 family prenyltransferase n=1 Tax=Streptomyces sp. NPDC000229 TaxID=3154247 RepID=UPI0033291AD4
MTPPTGTAHPTGTRPAGAGPTGPTGGRPRGARRRAWAELLRVSALFSVPGDALAGAAAVGVRPNRRTVLAIGSSLCLYEAGMALNDWADRDEDAVDRPHRPIPSGRVTPPAALAASTVLTATGLALAARAGRAPLTVATALAATVWAYDLRLKHTRAAPAAMATARALDLLLGATATAAHPRPPAARARAGAWARARSAHRGRTGPSTAGSRSGTRRAVPTLPRAGRPKPGGLVPSAALPSAVLIGAHTYAVTAVSRHEARGGSTAAPLGALAATVLLGAVASRLPDEAIGRGARRARGGGESRGARGAQEVRGGRGPWGRDRSRGGLTTTLSAAAYLRTAAVPLLHAALNPSPPLTQRAVGGGIRAMIPLQAALAAREGAVGTGLSLIGLVPLARALARKVSPT